MSASPARADGDDAALDAVRARALARAAYCAPRAPARIVRIAIGVGVLSHLLVLLALREAMRPAPPHDAESIHVYFLPEPRPEPPLPEPPLPEASSAAAQAAPASAVAQPRPRAPAAAPSTALPAPQATASEAPAPISLSTLFNPDGSIRLPAAEKPSAHEAGLARGRELMARGHNLLHCRRSAYDPAPTPEQAGNQAAAGAAMWHLMFGGLTRNDPDQIALAARDADAAGEMASAKRAVAMRACDDDLYHASPPQPAKP